MRPGLWHYLWNLKGLELCVGFKGTSGYVGGLKGQGLDIGFKGTGAICTV